MADVKKSSPDHANASMVVDMQERQLLPVLSTKNDEHGIEEIQELGEIVNVNEVFNASRVVRVDAKNIWALGQEGYHRQTPYHVNIQQDLSHVVNLRNREFLVLRGIVHQGNLYPSASVTQVTGMPHASDCSNAPKIFVYMMRQNACGFMAG